MGQENCLIFIKEQMSWRNECVLTKHQSQKRRNKGFWRHRIAPPAHLQRSDGVSLSRLTDALLWFGVHTFPALPQHHVNLHVNQQSDDEGNVEGHDGRVHHKGRIGDHTERLITGSCGNTHRVSKAFSLLTSFTLTSTGIPLIPPALSHILMAFPRASTLPQGFHLVPSAQIISPQSCTLCTGCLLILDFTDLL